ncbi:carbonic anhydrase 7-like isoform X2 [Haliotis rufescens]|uniref:carbonic anhydrase 7-like isoform X2 n=1 Tax=Haliotis rufescens TaxID=6454 RepID=UPI00201F16F6|nr:carbonic anhydrase 7-like isoform X2 [Haliotis rufescens]
MLIPIGVLVVATNVYVAAESALCPVPHHKVHFGYHFGSADDPSHWYNLDEDTHCCNGLKQSPIDIETDDLQCASLDDIEYEPHHRGPLSGDLKINGHGAILAFFENDRLVTKDMPFTDDEYVLHSVHFHSPSEHLVNGKHYDGELHMVHFKKEYGNLQDAVDKEDGLAVIGVFLQVSDESHDHAFNTFVDGVAHLKGDEDKKVKLDPRQLLLDHEHYVTYKGSLTTPPCSESVRWVLMKMPILTTSDRVGMLKSVPVSNGDALSVDSNVRPPQQLNGRVVFAKC